MPVSIKKIRKDLQELVEVDSLKKKLEIMDKENKKTAEQVKELRIEVATLRAKIKEISEGDAPRKKMRLIEAVEEIARDLRRPVKVVEIREALARDRRIKTHSENFYSVIATAMNNSPRFLKISPGVYEYVEPANE